MREKERGRTEKKVENWGFTTKKTKKRNGELKISLDVRSFNQSLVAQPAARADLDRLSKAVIDNPPLIITVDLMTKQVRAGDITFSVDILESARSSLTTGNWDFLGQLLEGESAVKKIAGQLPYMAGFKA